MRFGEFWCGLVRIAAAGEKEKIMVPLGAVESLWVPLGAERFGCRRGKQRNPDGSGLRSGGVGGYPLPLQPVNPSGPAFYRGFLRGNPSGNPSGAVRNPLGTGSLHRASGASGESLQPNQEETSFLQKGTKLTKILSEMMKDRIMRRGKHLKA